MQFNNVTSKTVFDFLKKKEDNTPKFPVEQLSVEKQQIPSLLTDFQKVNSHTLQNRSTQNAEEKYIRLTHGARKQTNC